MQTENFDAMLECVANCPNLKHVQFRGCGLYSQGGAFKNWDQIISLSVDDDSDMNIPVAQQLISANLKYLYYMGGLNRRPNEIGELNPLSHLCELTLALRFPHLIEDIVYMWNPMLNNVCLSLKRVRIMLTEMSKAVSVPLRRSVMFIFLCSICLPQKRLFLVEIDLSDFNHPRSSLELLRIWNRELKIDTQHPESREYLNTCQAADRVDKNQPLLPNFISIVLELDRIGADTISLINYVIDLVEDKKIDGCEIRIKQPKLGDVGHREIQSTRLADIPLLSWAGFKDFNRDCNIETFVKYDEDAFDKHLGKKCAHGKSRKIQLHQRLQSGWVFSCYGYGMDNFRCLPYWGRFI